MESMDKCKEWTNGNDLKQVDSFKCPVIEITSIKNDVKLRIGKDLRIGKLRFGMYSINAH